MKVKITYNDSNSKNLEEKFEEFLKYYNITEKIEDTRKAG